MINFRWPETKRQVRAAPKAGSISREAARSAVKKVVSEKNLLKLVSHTLECARKKLEIYRDNSDGEYKGGVEHTALINMIDTTLSMVAKVK